MKKNALYLVVAFILLFFIVLAVMLWRFSDVQFLPAAAIDFAKEKLDLNYSAKSGDDWYEQVAALNNKNSVLPATLMYIKLGQTAQVDEKPLIKYGLFISKCDSYSIFCLNRLAEQLGVAVTVVRKSDATQIVIAVENEADALKLVSNLKKLNIHSKIKEI